MGGVVCKVCDLENAPGARFCSACGASLVVEKQADALVGKLVAGKFRIEKLLGHGAMGRVYQATHVALERGVALKVMHDHLARSGEFATRFVREARSASKLDHPNSIRVLDFGRTDASEGNLLYLVMELFVGTDLYGLLRDEGPLDIKRAGHIVGQILSALEDAHAIKLIHRDLKPENVLVGKRADGTEIAKLCDFGIAKLAQQEGPKLSNEGSMIGTPLYMSPEAACGHETDARADIYSLGVMLYEVMTGTRPFDAPSPLEVARLHVEEPPQPPAQRAPERNIPLALERVILKSLQKKPEARWQTAREFRAALESALGADPGKGGAGIQTTPCASCGAGVPLSSRFCPSCGQPRTLSATRMPAQQLPAQAVGKQTQQHLAPPAPDRFGTLGGLLPDRLLGDLRRAQHESRQERRTLSALVVDLIGADDAGDPEEIAGRIGDRYELVARVLGRFEVTQQGTGGARVTALFGLSASPEEAEGLVAKAIEAAYAIKHESGNARWFKAGVASGVFLVTPGQGGPTILGAAAQTAGRHADTARGGEILVDESIRGRVGEGHATAPSRGGLFQVREDLNFVAANVITRPIVGRDAEIDVIVAGAKEAMEGRGQVIAIRGEAGIGKTAVVREAINRLRELPIRWYRVACRPTGNTSLGAMRDLVLTYTGLGRGAAPEAVKASLGGERGSLATLGLAAADQAQLVGLLLAPSLGPRRPGSVNAVGAAKQSSLAGVPPDVLAREGCAAIRNFLGAALRKGNVGFIVEDLQWIDPASATLLSQVASAIGRRAGMLILTARAGIWSDWNAPHFKRIVLGPLPAPAASRLLSSMLPEGEVPVSVAQPILQRASGNPLFLESIVEALRASGALTVEGGRYALAAGAKIVAEGLRGLVEARLRALDADSQRCLLLAAVAGSEVELSDLQALAGVEVRADEAVKLLSSRGLVEERARGEGGARRIGFANEGVREVVYDTIPLAERKALHAALAERWEAIRAATRIDPVPLEELARHWELASEPGPAVARLEEAALGLLARGEPKTAVALLRRAAVHASAVDGQTGARVLGTLAEASSQLGDLPGVETALEAIDKLTLDAASRRAAASRGDRSRGTAHRRGGRAAEAAVVLQRAVDRALESRDVASACDAYLDLSAAFEESNDTQKALQAALSGVEMASSLADKSAGNEGEGSLRVRLSSFLNAIGRLYLRRDDAVRATDYFRGALAQSEKANDAAGAARALANLGHIAARREDFRAASAETTRALRLAQQAGDRMSQARIHVNLGHYLARLGRRDEAEESYRAAQALAEAIGWNEGVAVAHQALDAITRA